MLRCLESICGEFLISEAVGKPMFPLPTPPKLHLHSTRIWSVTTFHFFPHTFFFFWPMPLFMIYRCEMSSGFLTGDEVATQHALLSVHDLKSRCSVPDYPGTLTEDLVSQGSWCASVICVVTQEQKSKNRSLSFMQFLHSVQTFLLEFQLCCWRTGVN